MGSRFREWLTENDFYGHHVTVNFHGSDTYKTKIGGVVSISTYILMILNFAMLLTAFIDGSR